MDKEPVFMGKPMKATKAGESMGKKDWYDLMDENGITKEVRENLQSFVEKVGTEAIKHQSSQVVEDNETRRLSLGGPGTFMSMTTTLKGYEQTCAPKTDKNPNPEPKDKFGSFGMQMNLPVPAAFTEEGGALAEHMAAIRKKRGV